MGGTALFLVLFLVQTCIAPAVNSDHDDLALHISTATSTLSSLPAALAEQNNTCIDINKCRTLAAIVTSCLGTIFACVWVAVHKNMPGPEQSWISVQIESLKVIVVTLLVPEWVLAWALRQFLKARQIAKELEEATLDSTKTINNAREGEGEGEASDERGGEDETRLLATRTTSESVAEQPTFVVRLSWTIVHGFFIIMGGFHYYQDGKPIWPIPFKYIMQVEDSYKDIGVFALVKSRALAPPTTDELKDKSKGDTLSKTVAVVQTLWFIAQCIARRAQGMAITNLEIMTLAYTVITVAMYAAWWHKPLNVRCPVRVKADVPREERTRYFEWTNVIDYVIGNQDYDVRLSQHDRVPTFWSDCRYSYSSQIPLHADIIALSVAMVFGAVHCAAWSYAFPSPTEKVLWRASALAITLIPIPMVAAFAVFDPFWATGDPDRLSEYIPVACMALGGLLYIPARILLIALSLSTLRNPPLSAFQTVQWTTFVPHI
ncbi:hypothetical protein HWV62_15475 [Athelia sp. TMB]|nr:hypothetical protein HWV62_15475 [Athelia sp. TMB]